MIKESSTRSALVVLTITLIALSACGTQTSGEESPETASLNVGMTPRSYRMGFGIVPPRPDPQVALKGFEIWSQHADAAIQHQGVPWAKLLSGASPEELVKSDPLNVVNLFRSKGLTVAITVEPLDGLNRSAEAPELLDAGRSITKPEIQRLYRDYVVALATMTRPDYFGLAAEVNLFKVNVPRRIYEALVLMVNDAAADVAATLPDLPLYVSVQVDEAWGHSGQHRGRYVGVNDILADFAFMDVLGLSTYAIFGWDDPDDIPLDYFSRLVKGKNLPVILVEGGWASRSTPVYRTSAEEQARWVRRLGLLLDEARARFAGVLFFADIDVETFPARGRRTLALFASMGLTDARFRPKPALAEWDRLFVRPYQAPIDHKVLDRTTFNDK